MKESKDYQWQSAETDERGFTLTELLVALALVVILLTLGTPSLQSLIRNNQLAVSVSTWMTAAQLTRSEAITRGVRVTLCKSADGRRCTNGRGYEQGWIVFSDPNNNASVDYGEELIRVFEPIPAGSGITITGNSPVANYVSYTPDGVARLMSGAFQAGTLTACLAPKSRQIIINSVGRAKVVEAVCQ